MAVSTNNDRIVITVTKDLKKSLEELAERDNRSLSNYASVVLKRHVDSVNREKCD